MRALPISVVMVLVSQIASAQGPAVNSAPPGFLTIRGTNNLSSQVVGLEVHNQDGQTIGQIEDIALTKDGQTQAYVVSVGGFLGIGEHYVAANPSAVKVAYSETNKAWEATMNVTLDQLKTAPGFEYSGRIGEKACINVLR